MRGRLILDALFVVLHFLLASQFSFEGRQEDDLPLLDDRWRRRCDSSVAARPRAAAYYGSY